MIPTVCLAGILMELGRVRELEERSLRESATMLDRVAWEFWAIVRGERRHPNVELTPV
jgi:hypothetical protein